MAQDNLTQNTVADSVKALPQSPSGGMNQVSSGPAGLLYSLSNELIMIYNELQDLYGKVAMAETSVQQSTIIANAASQRQAAVLRAVAIGCQAGEAIAGAAVTGITGYKTAQKNSALDTEMAAIEDKLAPLKALDGIEKTAADAQGARRFGQGVGPQQVDEVAPRMNDLLDRRYDYSGTRTDAAELRDLDQHAINAMNPDQYRGYKDRLGAEINTHEKRLNTKQSTRLENQQTFKQYGDIFSQGANIALKSAETTTTTLAGKEDANIQVANGVQSMANSTADSARGSIGQNYAKISDAIAAARQGANAYAQT
jgi:hypothetical protein